MVKRDFTRLTPDEKINGIKASKLPDHIRSKYHGEDVREAIAQSIELTIQLGINMGLSPEDALLWARKLQEAIPRSEFDSWVATLLDGGPSIFMNSLSELKAAYPKGAAGVALVRETDPAKIYVWNGTTWEDFGDYQGIEVKDGTVTSKKIALGAVGPLNIMSDSDRIISTNKFDKYNVKGGYWTGTIGQELGFVVHANWSALSNPIPVSPGDVVRFSHASSNGYFLGVSQNGFIVQMAPMIKEDYKYAEVVVQPNVVAFYTSIRSPYLDQAMITINEPLPGTYTPYSNSKTLNWLSIKNDNIEDGIDVSKIKNFTLNNLIDFDTIHEDHYYGFPGEYIPFTGRAATEPIEVSKGETYRIPPIKSPSPIAYLDSAKKLITHTSVPDDYINTQPYTFTIPNNDSVKYMIITLSTDSIPLSQQVIRKVPDPDITDSYVMQGLKIDYENVNNKPTSLDSPRFENKRLLVTGDSITEKNYRANRNWHDYLKDWLNLGKVYNDGRSGSGLVKNIGIVHRLPNWESNYGTESDVDFILLMGNMNDGTSTETGDWNWLYGDDDIHKGDFTTIITDTNKTDSMWYALRYTVETIIEKYPNTPFGYITSQPRSMTAVKSGVPREGYDTSCWGRTSWFEEWVDAIFEVCGHYSVPVLDLYHESNLRPWNDANNNKYFTSPGLTEPDGIHPNDEGQEVMAWKIKEFVKQYM